MRGGGGSTFVDMMVSMCDSTIPLTTGEWEEWGNPNEETFYEYMLSYGPMENISPGPKPEVLVTSGLHDPRVAYWEGAKYAARLREATTNDADAAQDGPRRRAFQRDGQVPAHSRARLRTRIRAGQSRALRSRARVGAEEEKVIRRRDGGDGRATREMFGRVVVSVIASSLRAIDPGPGRGIPDAGPYPSLPTETERTNHPNHPRVVLVPPFRPPSAEPSSPASLLLELISPRRREV